LAKSGILQTYGKSGEKIDLVADYRHIRGSYPVTDMARSILDENREKNCICSSIGTALYLRVKLYFTGYGFVLTIIR
jgi:hypothetical protein